MTEVGDMHFWRVTKYDPRQRDRHGRFRGDAWTSVSDVGRSFAGMPLTWSAYRAVEDAHAAALRAFVRAAGDPELTVVGLERNGAPRTWTDLPLPSIHEGSLLLAEQLDAVIRSVLREELWCRLVAPTIQLRFGWDYYCYVASESASDAAIVQAKDLGLFVEPIDALPASRQ